MSLLALKLRFFLSNFSFMLYNYSTGTGIENWVWLCWISLARARTLASFVAACSLASSRHKICAFWKTSFASAFCACILRTAHTVPSVQLMPKTWLVGDNFRSDLRMPKCQCPLPSAASKQKEWTTCR